MCAGRCCSMHTIGERVGRFNGMVERRQFRVVVMGPGHGVGEGVSREADAVVEYSGKTVEIAIAAKRQLQNVSRDEHDKMICLLQPTEEVGRKQAVVLRKRE